ncbi:MAG: hypothetical protein ACLGI6_16595 [Gammaproteobacteria bacterium]
MLPPWEDGDARWLEAGIDDWSGLRAAIRDGAGLCGAPLDYVLLKPAAIEAPVLDEAEQRLRWTLHDAAGSTLTLHVPCRSWQRDRIANLDAWCASGVQVAAVLARVVREVSTSMLEPVSLMTGERGALRSISLDYERPSTSAKAPLAARLARLLSVSPRPPAGQAPAAHLAVLDGLLDVLEAKAMTGRLHLLDAEAGTLTELLQRLRALGLDTIATQLTRYLSAPSAAEALRIVNLCHTCAELDTGFLA